ncbi:DUF6241 domain-containing protein [Halobacillus sp. BBL2006]|uniref:DUF6241 domain-containing protein n=1 Tax=Halobacillus sp. BBL2006 TaxID=1543706 RepID=UPI0005437BD8|nr:DUF6241 domain-containing protein [Halobacillus sp. BBL2006]KHE67498.1 hypothetical protein LD39_17250 [Halobacillus sp. BBL2006]
MKKIIGFGILGIFLLAGVAGWYAQKTIFNSEAAEAAAKSDAQAEAERAEGSGAVSLEELNEYEKAGKNPFGQAVAASEMDDDTYQEYIHWMSHQKVEARKKWGYYELHPKRVTWLLEGLEQAELTHEKVYREILEKWKAEDFSTADEDHNRIWRLQNGTVGKASGILSPEEEAAFIQTHN